MKKFFVSTILMLIGAVLILGCIGKNIKYLKTGNSDRNTAADLLIDGRWILTEINGTEVVKENAGEDIPSISFKSEDSTVSGFTGCNVTSGTAVVTEDAIIFKDMSISKMYCPDAQYEYGYVNLVFSKEKLNYKIDNETLSFFKDGSEVMVFKKEVK